MCDANLSTNLKISLGGPLEITRGATYNSWANKLGWVKKSRS